MNTEKCQNCIWLYNGFCTCEGLKPCTKAKIKEKTTPAGSRPPLCYNKGG